MHHTTRFLALGALFFVNSCAQKTASVLQDGRQQNEEQAVRNDQNGSSGLLKSSDLPNGMQLENNGNIQIRQADTTHPTGHNFKGLDK